ncbi:MAG TPA: haloacid dehalogenase type II [Xanthobacteraceae bacterium]|jgi:2-haloacid dehalogenase|nr:haloacid dehalogenase type II [Xanthobacteraceae bacterium]
MNPPVFVFDAYGTLLDVHAAIERHREAAGPNARALSQLWRTKQLEYTWTLTLAGRYADFWTVTQHALDYALAQFPDVDMSLKPRLLDAYMELTAFPDARATLRSLKQADRRTAILSNGTLPMLAAATDAAELRNDLDALLSVDTIQLYKPHPEVYRLATDAFGVAPSDIVFVSSNRWDVMGAASFGFRTAWINRSNGPDEYTDAPAQRVLANLGALASLQV